MFRILKSPIQFALPAILGCLFFFLAGCTTPQVGFSPTGNPLSVSDFTEVEPAEVIIYVTRQPERPYEELGILTFNTLSQYPNERTVFELFRQRAAGVGADGVIMLESREEFPRGSGNAFLRRYAIYESGSLTFRGLAIRHMPDSMKP